MVLTGWCGKCERFHPGNGHPEPINYAVTIRDYAGLAYTQKPRTMWSSKRSKQMTTWTQVSEAAQTAKNVQVRGEALIGNDGLILTQNAHIALGYVKADWDAINCTATR
jgi:hypothetical protein